MYAVIFILCLCGSLLLVYKRTGPLCVYLEAVVWRLRMGRVMTLDGRLSRT